MSGSLEIDGVSLRGAPTWRLARWDTSKEYVEGIQKLSSTKAVDVIALRTDEATDEAAELFFIEVTDFVGHHIESKRQWAGLDLAVEVAQKVRDTLAGLCSEHRQDPERRLAPFAAAAVDRHRRLWVLLLAFFDLHRLKEEVDVNTITLGLKRALSWLPNCRVRLVTTQKELEPLGLSAKRSRPR